MGRDLILALEWGFMLLPWVLLFIVGTNGENSKRAARELLMRTASFISYIKREQKRGNPLCQVTINEFETACNLEFLRLMSKNHDKNEFMEVTK